MTGKAAQEALGRAWLTCNKNSTPGDTQPPTLTSGIRLGTPAATTRGFKEAEFTRIGDLIADILDALEPGRGPAGAVEQTVRQEVEEVTRRFPIYGATQRVTPHMTPNLS